MNKDITEYNAKTGALQPMCDVLSKEISDALPGATSKLFHAHPAWFINDNPIVGYDAFKEQVNLLFWSGQSFDEPDLEAQGKFKAAGLTYHSVDQIDTAQLQHWLEKSVTTQWDYKNLRVRNGELREL